MKKIFCVNLMLLALAGFAFKTASAQTSTKLTDKAARAWVKKGEWRNGLKLKMFAGLDNVEFAKQYNANKALWDKAFAYLRETNLETLAPGKYPIDGDNAFATVTDGPTKEYDKTGWESHRNYLDIHLTIKGKEKIGVMNPATAVVTEPYDAGKDIAHYDVNTKGTIYTTDPETLMIFFPQDSHRPGIKADGYDSVKKVVIKIRMAQ